MTTSRIFSYGRSMPGIWVMRVLLFMVEVSTRNVPNSRFIAGKIRLRTWKPSKKGRKAPEIGPIYYHWTEDKKGAASLFPTAILDKKGATPWATPFFHANAQVTWAFTWKRGAAPPAPELRNVRKSIWCSIQRIGMKIFMQWKIVCGKPYSVVHVRVLLEEQMHTF